MMHPRCLVGWVALVLALGTGALAQPPAQPVAPEQRVENAADKVEGLDIENMPEWASLNFRLYVRLNNGRNIIGIARNGNVFEKIVVQGSVSDYEKLLQQRYGITPSQSLTLVFVKATPRDPEVGIRLWHHDASGGYIFILYRDIASVKRLQVITPAELKELDERSKKRNDEEKEEIRKRWEAYRRQQREAFKKQIEGRRQPGDGTEVDPQAGTGAGAEAGTGTGTEAESAGEVDPEAIFKRFHPSMGWTPGRKRVIEWRKWTLGTFPTDEEKEFLAGYGAWKKAYDKWMSEYGEKEQEGATGAPPPAR